MQRLEDAVSSNNLELLPVQRCSAEEKIDSVLRGSTGLPVLVLSPDGAQLLGIVTPFDLL